jgi:hypothetical protein
VRVFDLQPPSRALQQIEYVRGSVLDRELVPGGQNSMIGRGSEVLDKYCEILAYQRSHDADAWSATARSSASASRAPTAWSICSGGIREQLGASKPAKPGNFPRYFPS